MVTFEWNGKSYYIDGRLKKKIDKRIISSLKKKDKDAVFVVDGQERVGKSVFAQTLAAYLCFCLGTKFDITNICMNPKEFKSRVMSAEKNEVIIYDEAHRGMASARSLSEVNNILKDLMMEMGQRNLFVLIVIPTFFLLDKYAALFRTKGLFHVYERKGQRGFWCLFNRKYKLKLYNRGRKEFNYNCMRWPYFRGRFLEQYAIDEDEYRRKKGHSFTEDKVEKIDPQLKRMIYQRDILMCIVNKELKLSSIKMGKLLGRYDLDISSREIRRILEDKRDTSPKPMVLDQH